MRTGTGQRAWIAVAMLSPFPAEAQSAVQLQDDCVSQRVLRRGDAPTDLASANACARFRAEVIDVSAPQLGSPLIQPRAAVQSKRARAPANLATACVQMGERRWPGWRHDHETAVTMSSFLRSCASSVGHPQELDASLRSASATSSSTAISMRPFEEQCRSGYGPSCFSVAVFLETCVESDGAAAAIQWLDKGCELGHGLSCLALGGNYAIGLGVARDIRRSRIYTLRGKGPADPVPSGRTIERP